LLVKDLWVIANGHLGGTTPRGGRKETGAKRGGNKEKVQAPKPKSQKRFNNGDHHHITSYRAEKGKKEETTAKGG